MNNSPLISVVMSVFNTERYLREAIESILNQTFSNFELIIINDGSSDSSESIIKSFKDKRIKYINNISNKGLIYCLNLGISISSGKYIARMDADDISLPNRFESQISYLKQNPSFSIVGSSAILINEEGAILNILNTYIEPDLIFTYLFFGNRFIHTSIFGKKEVFKKFQYNPNYFTAEDFFLWSQIAREFKMSNIEAPLVKYRVHNESISVNKLEKQEECVKRIFLYHLELLGFVNLEISQIELHYKVLRNKNNLKTLTWLDVSNILKWLINLKSQNDKLKVYDQITFNYLLKQFWFIYFNKISNNGLKAIPYIFSSIDDDFNLYRKIKLTLKCILIEIFS